MTLFPFTILLPEKRVFDGEVLSVTVTAADGGLAVLAGHAPMLALLAEGPVKIRTERETIEGVTGPGILRVDPNGAVIMVHTFAWAVDTEETLPAEETSEKNMLL